MLLGLLVIVLFMDTMYYFRAGIVFTVGRVSIVGEDVFTFTGSFLLDLVVCYIFATILSIYLCLCGRKNCLFLLFLLPGYFFLVMSHGLALFYLVILIIAVSLYMLKTTGGNSVLRGLLYGLSVLEFWKIIYLLVLGLTNQYLWFTTPLYVNIIVTYYLWPVIPFIIYVLIIYGGIRLSYEIGLITRFMGFIKEYLVKVPSKTMYIEAMGERVFSPYLFIGLALSIIIGIIPYLPTLNPKGLSLNTDWIYYYNWLKEMISGDMTVLYTRSDRPLYLLILYSVWLITRVDPRIIAVYHNIALFPLYVFSTYLLALRWSGKRTAELAAVITPFSPVFLSFIYGGFQANLFAISLVYVSLYLLMSRDKQEKIAGLFILATIMFIHEWTWTQYIIVLAIYVLAKTLHNLKYKQKFVWIDKILIIYIVVSLLVDFSKQFLFSMFSAETVFMKANIMTHHMGYVDSLHWYTTIFTGGTLDNPLFFILAVMGIDLLGLCIPGIAVILSLAPCILPWNIIMYRLVLNTPLNILAAHGLEKMNTKTRVYVLIALIGLGLWRLYSIIPGLSLTP